MNRNKKIIFIILAISLIAGCVGQRQQYVPQTQVPITYEQHVEYPRETLSNGACWITENIYIKNTDSVGGMFKITFYDPTMYTGPSYPVQGQYTRGLYVNAFSTNVEVAGGFPCDKDTRYPPIQYSVDPPTKYI